MIKIIILGGGRPGNHQDITWATEEVHRLTNEITHSQ